MDDAANEVKDACWNHSVPINYTDTGNCSSHRASDYPVFKGSAPAFIEFRDS